MKLSIKHIFDWTIVHVCEPVLVNKCYEDVGEISLYYEVKIMYKHHGTCGLIFPIDEHKFGMRKRETAEKYASDYYHRMCKKVEGQRKKILNENPK
jgi:hypothetical protein